MSYKKALTINLGRLNKAEYTNYMSEFRALLPLTEIPVPGGDSYYECKELGITSYILSRFDDEMLLLQDLTRFTKKSTHTALLEEKDAERDKSSQYIKARANVEVNNPDETVSQAAVQLSNLLLPYAQIETMAYDQETQVINGMLFDLEKEENKAYVATLGLADAVARLKEQNEQYVELLRQRSAEQLGGRKEDSKTVRLRLDKEYDYMVAMAQASHLTNPTETSEKFIDELNALITRTQNLYNQRKGLAAFYKAQKKKEEEENKPTDPQPDDNPDTENPGGDGFTPVERE